MSTKRWVGDAQSVAEVKTVEITAYDASTTYKVTINGKTISVAGTTDADGTASALATAWNASTEPEVAEITATVVDDVITFTHDTAGVPFTISSSVSGGTGTIGSVTSVTSASGPNWWDVGENWEGGVAPVDDDDVVFDTGSVSVLYGLGNTDLTLRSLRVLKSYSGNIGLPEINANGYAEYRETYLQVAALTVEIGGGEGDGSGRIKLDTGNVKTVVLVYDTGQPAEFGIPAVLWKSTVALGGTTTVAGDTASENEVQVLRGSFGAAIYAGETATIETLRVGFVQSVIGDAQVQLGKGVSITNLDQSGGVVTLNSSTTTIDMTNGELSIFAGTHAALNIDGGTCYYRSTGTLTQGRVGSDGVLDLSRDMRARTITNLELNEQSTFRDPFKTATFTNAIQLPRTGVEKLREIQLGDHYTIQRGTIP